MMNKWDILVKGSKRKKSILHALLAGPMDQTEISKKTKIDRGHISRTLAEMLQLGLVEILNTDAVERGKLYQITRKGKDTLKQLSTFEK